MFRRISYLTIMLSIFLSFNVFAMPKNRNASEPVRPTPEADTGYEYGDRWTWLSDFLCVQFRPGGPVTARIERDLLQKRYDMGLLTHWGDNDGIKKRDSYIGKWSQNEEGIWSFIFDDHTIPIGVTNIDGVTYAFSAYGELRDGVIYYGKQKTPYDTTGCLTTGPDGLVSTDNPEFLEWLSTQYLPECTSHE